MRKRDAITRRRTLKRSAVVLWREEGRTKGEDYLKASAAIPEPSVERLEGNDHKEESGLGSTGTRKGH